MIVDHRTFVLAFKIILMVSQQLVVANFRSLSVKTLSLDQSYQILSRLNSYVLASNEWNVHDFTVELKILLHHRNFAKREREKKNHPTYECHVVSHYYDCTRIETFVFSYLSLFTNLRTPNVQFVNRIQHRTAPHSQYLWLIEFYRPLYMDNLRLCNVHHFLFSCTEYQHCTWLRIFISLHFASTEFCRKLSIAQGVMDFMLCQTWFY